MTCFQHLSICNKKCETKKCGNIISCTESYCSHCKTKHRKQEAAAEYDQDQIRRIAHEYNCSWAEATKIYRRS